MKITNSILVLSHFMRARWRWRHLHKEALERYQQKRAERIVEYAARYSSFYREYWKDHDLHNWRELPVVDKRIMMEHFDRFTTRGVSKEEAMAVALQAEQSRDFAPQLNGLTVGLSSGTSGHRGLFLVSAWEQASWAGVILARTLQRPLLKPLRVAFFLRSNSNLYEEIGGGSIQFRYFDLMQTIEQTVSALNILQPDIILAPPSMLGLLVKERIQSRLQIQPERLISIAEVLEEQDRIQFQEIFQCPVQQIYQCTEGLLAVSCQAGSLHIQEDLVALQFEPLVEEDPRRVTPIVTDLWRRTQPIVRYRLNDVLQLSATACTCGSTFQVIETIEGRCDDICYFMTHEGNKRAFFADTIRRMVLLADSQIKDYQAFQSERGQLRIHLAIEPTASFGEIAQAVRESVATTIKQYQCRPATVQVEEGLLPQQKNMKRRRVQRLYQEE